MLILITAYGLLAAGIFLVGYYFLKGEVEGALSKRLSENKPQSKSALLKISRPLFTALVMPYSTKFKNREDANKKVKRTIVSAGLEDEITPDELFAFKILLGFFIPIFLFLYFKSTGTSMALWVLLGMMMVMYYYPTLWVNGLRKTRQENIKLQLPFVIDLLTLSTEAGLDFIGALQKVVEKTKSGPLVDELTRMLQQIQLGTTRAEALRDWGWRIDLSETSSLVAVLVTADQMGSPLGGVLRVQSDLIRTRRFTEAEKKGAAASQKILFPLIFFIMPAVFVMIFGPVILGFFAGK